MGRAWKGCERKEKVALTFVDKKRDNSEADRGEGDEDRRVGLEKGDKRRDEIDKEGQPITRVCLHC